MHLGAYGGDIFGGILAIGCNEDFCTIGYQEYKNQSALDVPLYLLNGTKDLIAPASGYEYHAMLNSLKNTGLRKIETAVFDGGHEVPYRETVEALQRLLQTAR